MRYNGIVSQLALGKHNNGIARLELGLGWPSFFKSLFIRSNESLAKPADVPGTDRLDITVAHQGAKSESERWKSIAHEGR
jgi:hypothetical protein